MVEYTVLYVNNRQEVINADTMEVGLGIAYLKDSSGKHWMIPLYQVSMIVWRETA